MYIGIERRGETEERKRGEGREGRDDEERCLNSTRLDRTGLGNTGPDSTGLYSTILGSAGLVSIGLDSKSQKEFISTKNRGRIFNLPKPEARQNKDSLWPTLERDCSLHQGRMHASGAIWVTISLFFWTCLKHS